MIEFGDEAVVGGEIVFAFLSLRATPAKIHAHPFEARGGEHLHFTRPGVGEVNVDSEADGNDRRRERRVGLGGVGRHEAGEQNHEEGGPGHGEAIEALFAAGAKVFRGGLQTLLAGQRRGRIVPA